MTTTVSVSVVLRPGTGWHADLAAQNLDLPRWGYVSDRAHVMLSGEPADLRALAAALLAAAELVEQAAAVPA